MRSTARVRSFGPLMVGFAFETRQARTRKWEERRRRGAYVSGPGSAATAEVPVRESVAALEESRERVLAIAGIVQSQQQPSCALLPLSRAKLRQCDGLLLVDRARKSLAPEKGSGCQPGF